MTPGQTAVLKLCADSWDYPVTVGGGLGNIVCHLWRYLIPSGMTSLDDRCSDCT